MSTITHAPAAPGRRWLPWLGFAARHVLGWVLLVFGASKLLNPAAFAVNIRAYQIPFLPFDLTEIMGWALPLLEVIVGLLLVVGLFTRIAAAIGGLLMIAFIIGISSLWVRGIQIDCGCLEIGKKTTTFSYWSYFWDILRDIGLLLCAGLLVWRPRTPLSLDNWLLGPTPAAAHPTTDLDDDEESLA